MLPDEKVQVFKWTGKNDYVALCEPEYISFGGGYVHTFPRSKNIIIFPSEMGTTVCISTILCQTAPQHPAPPLTTNLCARLVPVKVKAQSSNVSRWKCGVSDKTRHILETLGDCLGVLDVVLIACVFHFCGGLSLDIYHTSIYHLVVVYIAIELCLYPVSALSHLALQAHQKDMLK